MRVGAILAILVPLALYACSPGPPPVQQNQAAQQTATPTPDKSIHVSEKGW